MNKKKIFYWSLYDFANSIVFINFLLYFSQWLVLDGGLSDFWYNATFAISTIILFFSAPVLAAYTDKFGNRKFFLNLATIGTALCYSLAAFSAMQGYHIFLIALFFLLGQYFYQLSFVFYNPLIVELSDNSHRGRVSGIGQFSNALGQVVGLAIMLPLAGSRLAPLLPSVAIFILLALPMMIFYVENPKNIITKNENIGFGQFYKKLIPFFSFSIATPLLIAFFFYNDALVTVTNNYSIYMQKVFNIPDSEKSLILMIIVVMNGFGGLLSGWIGDKIGIYKTLKLVLLIWIIALPIIALTSNLSVFIALTAVLGLLIGAMWAVSRAYMSLLLSKEDMGYGFSFYTILERFSTLVGPLTWGAMIAVLGTESMSYRIAMGTMTVFILIGFAILTFWKRKKLKNTVS
jgi:UMF1 family MFS transporter